MVTTFVIPLCKTENCLLYRMSKTLLSAYTAHLGMRKKWRQRQIKIDRNDEGGKKDREMRCNLYFYVLVTEKDIDPKLNINVRGQEEKLGALIQEKQIHRSFFFMFTKGLHVKSIDLTMQEILVPNNGTGNGQKYKSCGYMLYLV